VFTCGKTKSRESLKEFAMKGHWDQYKFGKSAIQ
jgi:hypothetical protein